jgi:acyl-ACP thioesterase
VRELPELVDRPSSGRTYTGTRTVSLADVAPDGRMRFDAMARFLGDVANDDTDDAGFAALGLAWVARRATFVVHHFPHGREPLTMTTWCSGTGKRWAERRTSITGPGIDGHPGARVEAVALWIHLDSETGRPATWGSEFADVYLPAAGGREVSARLALEKLPSRPEAHEDDDEHHRTELAGRSTTPWTFRRTDLDVFDHVNNAAYLSVLEESLGTETPPVPMRVDIEWHRPVGAGDALCVIEHSATQQRQLWITDDAGTCAAIATGPVG